MQTSGEAGCWITASGILTTIPSAGWPMPSPEVTRQRGLNKIRQVSKEQKFQGQRLSL